MKPQALQLGLSPRQHTTLLALGLLALVATLFRGSRAAELFPVLAYEPGQQLFVLDDLSLGFGFVCEPLSSADRAQADRLSVLMNLDWRSETLVQIALWASPDIEERLVRMQALRIGHGDELLRESTQRRAEFLRAGTEVPLGPASELRLRDIQVIVTDASSSSISPTRWRWMPRASRSARTGRRPSRSSAFPTASPSAWPRAISATWCPARGASATTS
jgi:hypothetical protein